MKKKINKSKVKDKKQINKADVKQQRKEEEEKNQNQHQKLPKLITALSDVNKIEPPALNKVSYFKDF